MTSDWPASNMTHGGFCPVNIMWDKFYSILRNAPFAVSGYIFLSLEKRITQQAVSLINLNIQHFTKQPQPKTTATERCRHLFAAVQITGGQQFMRYFQFQAGLIMPLGGGK